ncbi:MAG: mechanosensitive ion channel family protein [Acidobacteriota bacterium]|nr:mechanosensitive ion channel family protein [Acidobacteriota bacterium]
MAQNAVWETVQEWLDLLGPNPWIQAAVIVVVSIVVAKVVDWTLCSLIGRWVRRTSSDLDDKLISILHRPIFISVLMIGLGAATILVPLDSRAEWLTLAVLKTIAIFVWLGFALGATTLIIAWLGAREDRFEFVQPRTVPLFDNVAKVLIIGAGVYFVFLSWNIDVTAWLASAGIIGIALGFAAKDTLANLFSGVFILADAPYKIGDYIVLDSGERGQVTAVGIRSTRILTRDDVEITIPNAVMGNAKITNETGGPHEKERIRTAVGVAYGSDIDKVEKVLLDVAQSNEEICSDPVPRVRFRGFGDSSLDFELLTWIVEPVHRGRLLHELNRAVYKKFAEAGIEIPFPQRDVYIKEMPRPDR